MKWLLKQSKWEKQNKNSVNIEHFSTLCCICVCMYVYICVYIYMCACMCVCVCVICRYAHACMLLAMQEHRETRVDSLAVFLSHVSPLVFWDRVSHSMQDSLFQKDCQASKHQGSACHRLWCSGVADMCHQSWLFRGCWESKLRSLYLQSEYTLGLVSRRVFSVLCSMYVLCICLYMHALHTCLSIYALCTYVSLQDWMLMLPICLGCLFCFSVF